MFCDDMLVVPQLHDFNLILLALLFVVLDLTVAVVEHFSALSDLTLQTTPLILEPDSHFPYFTVNHGFPLAFHQVSQLFKLLRLALLRCLVSSFPLLNLI